MSIQNSKVTVNDFMDTMMSDPGPHCLVWLPLLHRLASVETGKLVKLHPFSNTSLKIWIS